MVSKTKEPKLDSLFRIQTIMLLRKKPMSGYDLAKELEDMTGNKPSSGKLYPFLHELKDSNYISEIETDDDTARSKSIYELTKKGQDLVDELAGRMSNILDARLQQILDTCHHCGAQIYESKVTKVVDGEELIFCCEHCMGAWIKE